MAFFTWALLKFITPYNKDNYNNKLWLGTITISTINLGSYLLVVFINPGVLTAVNPLIDISELRFRERFFTVCIH